MAASRSFSFEERDFNEASNAPLAPGSVPDFESVCLLHGLRLVQLRERASERQYRRRLLPTLHTACAPMCV